MKKILIVGGVAGGATTATRLRRLSEDYEIIVFEKGDYVSFANCGLPYHLGGSIPNRESLILQTPESLKTRFNLDIRIKSEVTQIFPNEKKIKIKNETKEYFENYDYLVLSPGAKPIIPNIEGINNKNIFTLRNIADMDRIKSKLSENIKSIAVIGGGFIGIECAENMKNLGIDTTLVEANSQILSNFDKEMANILENEIRDKGVNLILNDGVTKFETLDNSINVFLKSNTCVTVDAVILAIGVTPDTNFLHNSGIALGEKGHILVNSKLKTNYEDIYALGDSILVENYVTRETSFIPLAGPANRQGRIVADNIFGKNKDYIGSLGTSIIKVFDFSGATTGINEKLAKTLNLDYEKIYLHPNNHATYYPNASQISIKVLYEKNSKEILGAQAIGIDGVDKFIDTIATTLKFNGTIDDLAELELAYAPPYLSAKSPANMVGFIGQNIEENLFTQIFVDELENFNPEHHFLIDVREEVECINNVLKNSINIPLTKLRNSLNSIPKDKEIWVYCAVGLRGYLACRFLSQNGYNVKNIAGGIKTSSLIFNNSTKVENSKNSTLSNSSNIEYIDLSGLSCPGPLVTIKEKIEILKNGECLKVKVSDSGFYNDIKSWCKVTNNTLLDIKKDNNSTFATIQKGSISANKNENIIINENSESVTIVVFSGDLDKAIASFIIANGALALGKKVTMFFTFWGLSIIKKRTLSKNNILEKMFSFMLPKNSLSLPVSKMNFFGIGAKMIRYVMKSKDIMSLEELMNKSIENGVNLIACSMSMDVMGISKDELLENIEYGGVGQYLGEAQNSNTNLFI